MLETGYDGRLDNLMNSNVILRNHASLKFYIGDKYDEYAEIFGFGTKPERVDTETQEKMDQFWTLKKIDFTRGEEAGQMLNQSLSKRQIRAKDNIDNLKSSKHYNKPKGKFKLNLGRSKSHESIIRKYRHNQSFNLRKLLDLSNPIAHSKTPQPVKIKRPFNRIPRNFS